MTLTRSRKMILAILALAVAALVTDRLFLSGGTGPQRASASPAAAETRSGAAAPASPETEPPAPAQKGPRLATRLQAIAEQLDLDAAGARDAFTLPPAWLNELQDPPTASQEPEPEPEPDPAARFAEHHTLTSVILTADGGSAVVDGKVVPMGQAIDGFTLVRLTRSTAVFEADGQQVELRLRR